MNSEYRIRTDRAIEKAIAKNAARPAVKMSGNRGYAVGSVPSPIGDFDFLIGRMASRGYVYDPDTPARGDKFGFRHDPEAAQRHLAFEQARDMIVDALDQMHQPRDAFKFLYSVIQEHCRMVPEDQPKFTVPRLTLDGVRRQQSQRVQEFYRGLTPA